jgi:excisionase family DNA binding protein
MPASDKPCDWQSCADLIAERVQDGRYPPGLWLPGRQDLADELDARPHHVKEALTQLAATGLITYVPRTGYYAGDTKPERKRPQPRRPKPQSGLPGERSIFDNDYITADELADYLRVSHMTAYRIVAEGHIEGVLRINARSIRLPSASVRAYVDSLKIDAHDLNPDELADPEE